ncbi:retinol binding protein 2b, cellular [Reticulomyxa filosa]|uniref:Retinol binding protein 2b, cellular n=1 Tax=Reticulomyxa filosa TaxID=46433 RepID=X6NKX7_RETFI|nr:retinol binding protein 2b, cellular [Reticulomyxa filosa]|eukprot:ETO26573.1 retinol binding protein 2b, cellular [Reticulomyxa filosa]
MFTEEKEVRFVEIKLKKIFKTKRYFCPVYYFLILLTLRENNHMAQAPENKAPNFTGKWVLETTENLDKFLSDSEGWGWAMRKLAATAWAHQNILHDDEKNTIKVKMTNPKSTVVYNATIGGEEFEFVDLSGTDIRAQLSWSDDKTILRMKALKFKLDKDNLRLSERWLEGGKMKIKLSNEEKKLSMTQIFKKDSDKPEF